MSSAIRLAALSVAVCFLASCAALRGSNQLVSGAPSGHGTPERVAAEWFEANREQPLRLRAFLFEMPKGGDVHSHLSGAVYAESYLQWATHDKLCVNLESGVIAEDRHEPCEQPDEVAMAGVYDDPSAYGRLVDKLSLRNLAFAGQSGHDQFFASFGKFAGGGKGQMIAEVSNRAARQNIQYLELMLSAGKAHSKRLAKQVGFDGDIAATYDRLLKAGLRDTVADGRQELASHEQGALTAMACESTDAQPGCALERRYLLQVIRTMGAARVLAQMAYAFELARQEPLAVGLNMVAPEDNRVALEDYALHMRMLAFLGQRYPEAKVSLHAGELALGLVPPRHLRDHIRQAVEVAGARRIGHGVDLMYEVEPWQLLESMRARDVLVEICLTSNDAILGVVGDRHPLGEYLAAGVPVTLATDDEGVSRIDLTHEYLRAATGHGLGYLELKAMARNSLRHAFIEGQDLWQGPGYRTMQPVCADSSAECVSSDCQRFLERNAKAGLQWALERRFTAFEASDWLRRGNPAG